MSVSKRLSLLLAGVTLLLAAIAATIPARAPHLAKDDCANCHLATKVDASNAAKLTSTQEVLCARCHANSAKASHPSGFSPKRKLDGGYPLDWKGDLTCSTCHEIHGSVPGLMRHNRRGRELCMSCHDQAFFDRMLDGGVSIIASGHLDSSFDIKTAEIDSFSVQCMDCHQSLVGTNKVELRSGIVRHSSGSGSHPIGMSYADAERAGGFFRRFRLAKVIQLPGGKISCISCHDGYAQQHGKLVMSNTGSRLCFECHDL